MRRRGALFGSAAVGVGLTITLLISGDVGIHEMWLAARGLSPLHIVMLVAATGGQIVLSAVKWRLVMRRVVAEQADTGGLSFYVLYTALAGALAQFLTVYLSSTAVRGIAARHRHDVPLLRGAFSSGYEQAYDVLVLLALAAPTILAILLGWSLVAWIAGTVAALFLGCLMPLATARLFSGTPAAEDTVRRSWQSRLSSLRQRAQSAGLLAPDLLITLYWLSVVRYGCMLARTIVVAAAAYATLPWLDVAFGFAIAQASQIAGITPGNWGIAEWSWTGALVALGHGLSLAAGFALALRVVSFLGVLVVLAAAWVAHRALDQRSPQSSGADRPAAR